MEASVAPRFPLRRAAAQAALLLAASLVLAAVRQPLPGGLAWIGHWPAADAKAEDAYRAMTKPGDPPFVSLNQAAALQKNHAATFLDAREADDYEDGHIPGARELPFEQMDPYRDAALEGLRAESPIVVYCEGVGCELSLFLARELQKAGYKNVSIFYGGFPEWEDAGLPVEKSSGGGANE
ncbi:MAG: rhodanese-like domain-containing protein [Elusimicrobia bacterium]|nr:rhodanese-like domain-containing protein [Elusimicrobiota bacterium]